MEVVAVGLEEKARQYAEVERQPAVGRDVRFARDVSRADADLEPIVDGAIEIRANILTPVVCAAKDALLLL